MTLCTRCGTRPAPAPKSIEEDPICPQCAEELKIEEQGCPGYNDSCDNLVEDDNDLCPDCSTARLDAQSPRIPR